jgi:23S rRNA (cytidine1920-2'-O)/16S rRNA (cytidine1409-2'-O)-methyltransferase
MPKIRLDLLLVSRGLAPTREKAQAVILAGLVDVDGRRADKAGAPVDTEAAIRVSGPAHPFVSRGGVKLAAALDGFQIDPSGLLCLDVGASTGGFTDCLLQRGARRVYAVDVGRGQLDAKLRGDPRVVVVEGLNARRISDEHVPESVDLAVMDLSFISLRLVMPGVRKLLAPGARLIVLVKPQFEAGRGEVPRGGVVRSAKIQGRVVDEIARFGEQMSLEVVGELASPILGARGNREFLLAFRNRGGDGGA